MQTIPVATEQLAFVVARRPQPKVRDRSTGEQAMSNGQPIFLTEFMVLPADEDSDERMQQVTVSTVGEPPPVHRGDPVAITGLVARQYDFQNASGEKVKGVTFWAESIVSARGGR